ncbi:hypothetical protein BJ992_005270 [Sphaerisporangium rubeum]|uniref:Uncharacterized protein n=1 Tax=Sphaerisporangium rubeum TaxID=321317 RepID=A0A7X0IJH2_9ACTN|nr:hypothetical protein [Sphaerisporangium rubeum]MBB6475839.1 hypothetical protein [Sphaerisporangium rubeum]
MIATSSLNEPFTTAENLGLDFLICARSVSHSIVECDPDGPAAGCSRTGLNGGVVCLGHGLDYGEAEAQAFRSAGAFGFQALEGLEEAFHSAGRYFRSGVGHLDHRMAVRRGAGD